MFGLFESIAEWNTLLSTLESQLSDTTAKITL